MAFDQAYVRDWIKQELGNDVVHLEINDNQINQSIEDALRTFNNYMCETQVRAYYSMSANNTIQLEDNVRGVMALRFVFPESSREMSRINIFEIIYRMAFPRFPISDWYMFRSFYDMFNQVRGAEPDWQYDEFSKKIYVDAWSGPYDVYCAVAVDLTLESLDSSKSQYKQRFLELALARAKRILAKIRGKFTETIPAPGGNVATDANVLREEADKAEAEIVEWLKKIARFSKIMQVG